MVVYSPKIKVDGELLGPDAEVAARSVAGGGVARVDGAAVAALDLLDTPPGVVDGGRQATGWIHNPHLPVFDFLI